jgi:hypothetical protein
MQVISLGKITVSSAGTPVQASSTSILAHKVIIEPLSTNSGKSYVGTSAITVSSGAGLIKTFLAVAASGINDQLVISAGDQGNSIDVSQFWFDVATNGQGFIVSYVLR